jgi:hypothetical protein
MNENLKNFSFCNFITKNICMLLFIFKSPISFILFEFFLFKQIGAKLGKYILAINCTDKPCSKQLGCF